MPEPDFCESQLQQMTNTEIFNHLRASISVPLFPIVISPYWEEQWGWDTGLHLPWIGPAHMEQKGCNFFIQYKLSDRYDTSHARGWENWHGPFFRFNLGYRKRRNWDFSQRDHLIMLASSWVVVYVTNHVLTFAELKAIASQNSLCSTLPVLRVSSILSQHERVSFTPNSTHFCLHSEEEKIHKTLITETLKAGETTYLAEDLEKIFRVLAHYEESVGIREGTAQQALKKLQERNALQAKVWVAWYFLRHYLNVHWLRIVNGKKVA